MGYRGKFKAWDMFSSFLDTVFLVFLIAFFVYFFIVLGNFDIATKIVQAAMLFSWVGLIFIVKWKAIKLKLRKLNKDGYLDEIIVYFTIMDRLKDLFFIFIIPLFMFLLAYFLGDDGVEYTDWWQIIYVFIVFLTWHLILFRKRRVFNDLRCAVSKDKLRDELVVYFMPVLIFGIAFLHGYIDNIDLLQTLAVLIVGIYRHKMVLFFDYKKKL